MRLKEIGRLIPLLLLGHRYRTVLDNNSSSPASRSLLDNLDFNMEKQSYHTNEDQHQEIRYHEVDRRDHFVHFFSQRMLWSRWFVLSLWCR